MHDVFLSYAREDRTRAVQIADALQDASWSVWWDRDIEPGQDWDQAIEEALTKSRCVVVLWSKTSVQSRYVRAEARAALARDILIPVLLEKTRLPLEFDGLQAASLDGWSGARLHLGLQQLLKNVARRLEAPLPSAGRVGALREEDLAGVSEGPLDEEAVSRSVFRLEYQKQPLMTGFSVGKSTLLVSESYLYAAVGRMDDPQALRISAHSLADDETHGATLVAPPARQADVLLFDTTPWVANGAIGLDRSETAPGDEVICVVGVGNGTGFHRGKIEALDQAPRVAGYEQGPAQVPGLIATDIATEGGSAGAPLLRPDGGLVGIITVGDHVRKRSYAIPARRLFETLAREGLLG